MYWRGVFRITSLLYRQIRFECLRIYQAFERIISEDILVHLINTFVSLVEGCGVDQVAYMALGGVGVVRGFS